MTFQWRGVLTAISVVLCSAVPASAQQEVAAQDVASEDKSLPSAERRTITELMLESESMRNALEVIEHYVDSNPASLAPVEVGKQTDNMMTLRQCVDLALKQNPQVYVNEANVEAARARIGQAKSAYFPQVKASIAETWNDRYDYDENGWSPFDLSSTGSSIGGGGIGGGIGGGGIGGGNGGLGGGNWLLTLAAQNYIKELTKDYIPQKDTFSEKLTITQTLYSGGRIASAIRASEYLAQSEEWKRESTLNDIEYNTKQGFFDALLSGALVRVAEESVRTFERNLADAQQMYDVGMISSFEVLRAQTELGNRQADLVQARNGYRLAYANLHRVLAMPQEVELRITPTLDWLPNPMPVAYYIEEAKAKRPEILALQKAIAAQGEDIRRIKGSYKPQVAAVAEFQNTHDAGAAVQDGWLINVGAEWEIAAGGRRKHERKEAEASKRSLEYQLDDLMHLVELDVTQSFIQIQDSMAEIKRTRGTIDLAKEGLSIAELRFQQGVGTQSETLDAELALTSAESGLVQAVRNYAVGNAALERAIGKTWRTEAETPAAEPAKP